MDTNQHESEKTLEFEDYAEGDAQIIQIDESKRNIITNSSDPEIISLF